MLERQGFGGALERHRRPRPAVDGADVRAASRSASAARRRGCATRPCPLACGCIGQETTGAGGFARRCARCRSCSRSPSASASWRAPRRLDRRLHEPGRDRHPGAARRTATARSACATSRSASSARSRGCSASSPSGSLVDQVGLNHLTWVRARAGSTASDVLPELLADHGDELAELAGAARCGCSTSSARCPSYYLRYFYAHDEVLAEQLGGDAAGGRRSREIERELLDMYRDPALTEQAGAARAARRRVLQRGGDGAGRLARGRRRRRPGGRRRATAATLAGPRRRRRRRGPGARSARRARAARPARRSRPSCSGSSSTSRPTSGWPPRQRSRGDRARPRGRRCSPTR